MGKSKNNSDYIHMSIGFGFDHSHPAAKAIRQPSGQWEVISEEGEKLFPTWAFRKVQKFRSSKPHCPKVCSIMPLDPKNMHDNGLIGAVTQYDEIYVIDCNNDTIGTDSLHVAAFFKVQFTMCLNGQVEITLDKELGILEFRNVNEKPENVAWKKLIEGPVTRPNCEHLKIGLIVDSDLGNMEAYNRREKPILGSFFLPENVGLIYATADNSLETVNKLIRLADKGASDFIKKLKAGKCSGADLELHDNQSYSHFRFWIREEPWLRSSLVLNGLGVLEGVFNIAECKEITYLT